MPFWNSLVKSPLKVLLIMASNLFHKGARNMLKIWGQLVGRSKIFIICGLIVFLIFSMSLLYYPNAIYTLNSTKIKVKSMLLAQSDYTYLINMNFTFKMLPTICDETENILLILVHSATDHFTHRKVIRETWGQQNEDLKLLFLVGTVVDKVVQEKLEEENKQHSDILQGNFLDSYRNLTYKHVMALKYTVYHCPKVQFVLKVDDDVFVNSPTLIFFIKSYMCQNETPTKIFCSRLFNPPVLREGKWATTLEEFPESNYPTHCGGFAILYPQNVIYHLYRQAQKTQYFWVDDVFVSGICAKNSNVKHIGIENLVLSKEIERDILDLSFTNMTKPFLIGSLNLDENRIRSLWNFVVKNKPKTILEYLRID